MDTNSTSTALCQSVYYVIGNLILVGVALFGIITGILALITIPRLRLGICPSVLLFILALTDLLVLGFQFPQILLLENNYDSFSGVDIGTMKWYLRSYARRLRLTFYLFEGWMVICLTLNRFIFVRWPFYDGKYMTCKCAVVSVLSLALFTLVLEAPAFGKIVMSQMSVKPTGNPITTETVQYLTTTIDFTSYDATSNPETTTEVILSMSSQNYDDVTIEGNLTTTTDDTPSSIMEDTVSESTEGSTSNDMELSTVTNVISTDLGAEVSFEPITAEPNVAGVLDQILKIRDSYVDVLDRFVTTLFPIIVVIPFLAIMAAMLQGGHPRMRSLSHEVVMERSAVVIMLTGVTWYVLANLPYQVYSLVVWFSRTSARCEAELLVHVATITLTCAFKPLIYFIVCPHFRRTLGTNCIATCTGKSSKPKETFGTPSFDRISSRMLSSQDNLNKSRDSRDSLDSRGSFFDRPLETTEL